jgi:hypothetical protein
LWRRKTLFRAENDQWEPALPETAQKRSFEPETDRDERHGLSFRGVRSTNQMRNCASENLEIPGLAMLTIPE